MRGFTENVACTEQDPRKLPLSFAAKNMTTAAAHSHTAKPGGCSPGHYFFSLVTYQQLLRLNYKDTNFFAFYSLPTSCPFVASLFFLPKHILKSFRESLWVINFLRVCTSKIFLSPSHLNVSLDAFRISSLQFWAVLSAALYYTSDQAPIPSGGQAEISTLAPSLCTPQTKHSIIVTSISNSLCLIPSLIREPWAVGSTTSDTQRNLAKWDQVVSSRRARSLRLTKMKVEEAEMGTSPRHHLQRTLGHQRRVARDGRWPGRARRDSPLRRSIWREPRSPARVQLARWPRSGARGPQTRELGPLRGGRDPALHVLGRLCPERHEGPPPPAPRARGRYGSVAILRTGHPLVGRPRWDAGGRARVPRCRGSQAPYRTFCF